MKEFHTTYQIHSELDLQNNFFREKVFLSQTDRISCEFFFLKKSQGGLNMAGSGRENLKSNLLL